MDNRLTFDTSLQIGALGQGALGLLGIGRGTAMRFASLSDLLDSSPRLEPNAAAALVENGATEVSAYVTHGVLSGAAIDRVNKSVMRELVITDSIEASEPVSKTSKVRVVGTAPLIGEAIRRIANEESVSKLFD
jgi:ribose-phosphate pyrophosphokinase